MTKDYYSSENPAEKTYLVGVEIRGSRPLLTVKDSLKELALLADTAGLEVVGQTGQSVHQINPATFIGSGKVEEIKEAIADTESQVVVFDDELSPRHQRELEKRFGGDIKLLDRSALILDIFAQHAHTREGSLQVELAQYEYRLPRLTRQWTHLARQAGGSGAKSGVGLRGPGETQLEVDRREIGRRISKLKKDLEDVKKHRRQHRVQRSRSGIPVIALVGYTNAGKSTLLNAVSGANIYAADQLFATLDPTTRKVSMASGRQILLTDTVGFIQKLPTSLIAAFRATLEEITEADLILHVVDASHPNVRQHIESVEDTLAEINMPIDVPTILVWNKMDQCGQGVPKVGSYELQVMVSAITKQGITQLCESIETALKRKTQSVNLLIPYHRGDLVTYLFESASVEKQEHSQNGVILTVRLSPELYNRFKTFQI